ncbi:MAG: acyl-CoA dehydrogenase family protein [Candidatus Bathyarchaeia archaeon]
MDFELTEEQKEIQRAAREFAQKEATPELLDKVWKERYVPFDLLKKAADLGFICSTWDPKYGGGGLDRISAALIGYEFARAGLPIPTNFGADIPYHYGPEWMREQICTEIAKGEAIHCGMFTEPSGGSDLGITRYLDTKAVRDGNEWVINGVKTFITSAPIAKYGCVLVQTDPKAVPPYRGLTWIEVDMKTPGIEVRPLPDIGWPHSPFGEVSFSDVRVPIDNTIGEINRGFYLGMEYLNSARAAVGLSSCAAARGIIEETIKWVKERKVFGRPICDYQHVRFTIAELLPKIEAAELLAWKVLWMDAKGGEKVFGRDEIRRLSSSAKWLGSEILVETVNRCIRFFGGYAFTLDCPVTRRYLSALSNVIVEGVSEIHLDGIGRILFGPYEIEKLMRPRT